MKYLLAIILPTISFISRGKIGTGLICLFLQCTVIGWIPAAIWAFSSIQKADADKRTNDIINAIKSK